MKKTAKTIHGITRWSAQPTGPLQAAPALKVSGESDFGKKSQYPVCGSQCHLDARKSCRSRATTSGWVEIPIMLTPVLARSKVERGRDAEIIPIGTEIRNSRMAPPNAIAPVTAPAFTT